MARGLEKFIGRVGRPAKNYIYVHINIMKNDGHGHNKLVWECADLFTKQADAENYINIIQHTFVCKSDLTYVRPDEPIKITDSEAWFYDQKIQNILYKYFYRTV